MSGPDVLRFAAGALRGHRLRSGLSLLGVAIGVGSVIVLTSLGEGARVYVTGEFAALGTNLVMVLPGKTETTGLAPIFGGAPHDLTLDDTLALKRQVSEIRRIAPLAFGQAQARYGERSREATIAGTTPVFREIRKIGVRIGRYLPEEDWNVARNVCVLGAKIQQQLFQDQNPLGAVVRIGDERFRVIGVMAPRGVSIGMDLDEVIHVPVASAMKMFDQTSLFRIFVEVRSHDEIPEASAAIVRVLKERHDGDEDVTIMTQDSVLSSFGRILAILTAALGGIAGVSLSVAGIGIMNVMLVSVSERTREIGLLKAVGVTRGQILAVFLVEAGLLSVAGGLLGLGAGLGAAHLFRSFYPAFPAAPPQWAVTGSLAMSVLVGLIFGALPARQAARLDPVAALAGK